MNCKNLFHIILLTLTFNALGSSRNCTSKEVNGYKEEYEHHKGENDEPGFTYISGNRARDQYLKLAVSEIKSAEEVDILTKSSTNIQCTKTEVSSASCAQYTCVIRENKRFFWQR